MYAFDMPHLSGADLTHRPLEERRAILPQVVGDSRLVVSQELRGSAAQVVEVVRALALEVIAKRPDSIYEPGERSGSYLMTNA